MIARPKNRYFLSNRPQPFYPRNYLKLGADAFQADKKKNGKWKASASEGNVPSLYGPRNRVSSAMRLHWMHRYIKVCQCWVLNADQMNQNPASIRIEKNIGGNIASLTFDLESSKKYLSAILDDVPRAYSADPSLLGQILCFT